MFAHFSIIFLLFIFRASCEDNCPPIISKLEWGGKVATKIEYLTIPVKYVVIHHTVTVGCESFHSCSKLLNNMQDFHIREMKFDDIGYNFMIGSDGQIYEGTGWHKVGAHTRGYNTRSIAIAFIGNFSEKQANEKQVSAAKKLLECGVHLGELDSRFKLIGARQVSETESPGLELFRQIQKWPNFAAIP